MSSKGSVDSPFIGIPDLVGKVEQDVKMVHGDTSHPHISGSILSVYLWISRNSL